MSNQKYGCIGKTLQHSFSRVIHTALLPQYSYELWELPDRAAFTEFMTRRDFVGTNVTIPYKQDVIPYLSELSPAAQRIGAVNTIVNRGGALSGYNTDHFGLSALIRKLGLDLTGKKVLICGTGGTSKTAVCVAKDMGAQTVLRLSRSTQDDAAGVITYETALQAHTDAQIIINTTPVGMYPHHTGMPIDPACFPRLCGVVDAVYNPLRTEFVQQAAKKGVLAEGGLYMLVAQGVRAAELFHDRTFGEQEIQRIFRTVEKQKENIVLIGMPGAGKTTIGKLLAQKLNRPFVDTDDLITAQIGCTIASYFSEKGEAAFRRVEHDIIRDTVAPLTGAVIATGGGAVLDPENVDNLKQNGRLFFLDRSLERIVPTASRPLSSDAQALRQRYEERYPIYRQCADRQITVEDDPTVPAAQIEEYYR